MQDEYQRNCGKNISDVLIQSEMMYNPVEINQLGNKFNIDFDFSSDINDELDIIFCSTLVNKELRLRQLPHGGNL